jgi:valine--pyruvate aminotransferase
MSGRSGIRSIMDDIASAVTTPGDGEWLNLSPGNPSLIPEVVGVWRGLFEEALAEDFTEASCRYGPSRGAGVLVDAIVRYFGDRYDWPIRAENVLVGPGSQLLCFIATAVFTEVTATANRPLIIPCMPDYAGYHGLSLDAAGMVGVPPRIELQDERSFRYVVDVEAVRGLTDMGMMLLSSPRNPTGASLDLGELAALVEIADNRDVPLLVDHAYGRPFPMVVDPAVDPMWHRSVINSFTLSKAGLPGERLGFVIGPSGAIEAMTSFMANAVLHAPQLIQTVAARALESGEIDVLSEKVISSYYRAKRQAAEQMLRERLPASVRWRLHSSPGGMFCWLWIDHDWFTDLALYDALKARKVFVVPGRHFFVGPHTTPFLAGHGTRCVRLSLTCDEQTIAEGVTRLGEALEELRDRHIGARYLGR